MGPVYMDHYPAGASTKSFVHFAQLYNNPGSFAQYDYEDPEQVEMQNNVLTLHLIWFRKVFFLTFNYTHISSKTLRNY
jgi:hypothetical protein